MTDDEKKYIADPARRDESERCALLAEKLATIWEAGAAKLRKDGEYRGGWLGRRTFVRPRFEEAARVSEAGAHGLRTVARGCREGWDTRVVPETADEEANRQAIRSMRCG